MLDLQAFNGHVKGRAVNSTVRRHARVLAQEEGRQLAERCEALHVAGCMLYWAEGAKDRNQIRFTNSDPEMARFFVRFLRTYFNLGTRTSRSPATSSPTMSNDNVRSKRFGSRP